MSPDPELVRLRTLTAQLLVALRHVHSCGDCAESAWLACPGGRQALQAIKDAEADGRNEGT